jgi:hypothetical protein
MAIHIADIVAKAWATAIRDTPAADWSEFLGPRRTYRERLDMARRNIYGDVIPRIVLVRRNLSLLGKPRRAPRLPE